MSEESSNDAPRPVLPLDYFQPPRDSWRPMVRAVVWLTLLFEAYGLVSYAIETVCYFWQSTLPRFTPRGIPGAPLVVSIPMGLATLIVFIGAVDMRRLIDSGRRWVVGGAMMMLVVAPPTHIIIAIYYYDAYQQWRYGEPYVAMCFAKALLSAVGGCVWPVFLWKFFRRAAVREVFERA